MEEQPRQFEQIEALSKLADSIVHEMNNVLATIMGLASVLEAETDIHSSYFQDVQGILAASRKGLELTRNLVGFAHRERQHRERVSINNMIGLIRSLLQRTITPDVEIVRMAVPPLRL